MNATRDGVSNTHNNVCAIAIVGHTNTGKTSFLRSLLRQHQFGEVENRAGTTRHVEEVTMRLAGNQRCDFYDTPGMEDAMGVLDELDELLPSLRNDSVQAIHQFMNDSASYDLFDQEIKVLRQVLQSDVCIYVIDAREAVLGKYRDELQLLALCGKPILPLFNFTQQDNNMDEWKAMLSNLNLHVVADFDTVMFNQDHEQKLLEQLALLVSDKGPVLKTLMTSKAQQWARRMELAREAIATSLIDLAAWQETYVEDHEMSRRIDEFQNIARQEEQRMVAKLLEIYEFPSDALAYTELDLEAAGWTQDLFDADTWAMYGVDVGSAVARGGAVGFTVDVLSGGLTLGLGTAIGASAGLLMRKGREWSDKVKGYKVWRLNANCLRLMTVRQQLLLNTISSRRHANVSAELLDDQVADTVELPKPLKKARFKPYWSRFSQQHKSHSSSRRKAIQTLSKEL
ncbi:MAG: DUF3482 domain-containing protein [Pseudomonadota bacterium]